MKFITLHLKNYQAHVDTVINFVDGFNVIIGHTDAGKSSIIRALIKLIRDEPVGKGGVHIGKDEYVLKLTFEHAATQYILIRTVSTSKNEYSLQKVGEDVQSFASFGREIPQEILQALSMTLVQLENGEAIDLHFSGQYDVPFMLAHPASMRARLLGRIAGLHILGKATLSASKDERQTNTELTQITEACTQLENDIIKMGDVVALEHKVEQIQQLFDIATTLDARIGTLQAVATTLKTIRDTGKQVLLEYNALPQITADFDQLRKKVNTQSYLQQLKDDLQNIDNKIGAIIPSKEIHVDFTQSTQLIESLAHLLTIQIQLKHVDEQISGINLEQCSQDIEAAEIEWQNLLIELKICPVCKQPITQVHKHGETI